jgi:hypothetical protein
MASLVKSCGESESDSDETDYRQIHAHESWRSQSASVSEGHLPIRQFQIFLSGVHGRTITLEVALDDTVDAVLSKIHDKEGVPCNGPHRIVYNCCTLQRHRTLAPSCPQWAGQIFIQRAGRRTFVLNVTSDDTVASLKARLKWPDSRLIKSPLELWDDTRSLGSYGVRKEDTLLLCGRLCGGGVCMGKPTVVAPGENIAPQDAAPAPQAPAAPTAPEEVAAPAALYHDAVDAEGGAGKPAGDECREVVGDCASLSAGTPAGETSPLGASVVLDAPSTSPVSFPSSCCRLCRCRVRGSALKLPVPASFPRYCCSRSRCRGAYVGVGVGLGMCVGAGRPKVHKVLPDARVCLRNNTVYVCVCERECVCAVHTRTHTNK